MNQRSMTDEQMLAKYGYDKHPWLKYPQGTQRDSVALDTNSRFDPRPECIPSRDPFPFIRRDGQRRPARQWPDDRFDPNPEFARPPVNLILAAFRDDPTLWFASVRDIGFAMGCTPDQIDFASKVLTRLAKL